MNALTKITDEELFQNFKSGNVHAFEEIYVRYKDLLTHEAYKQMGIYVDAKDVVQDVFTSLIQKANCININVSLKAYLFKMLRYKIINNKRNNHIHNCCHNEIRKMSNDSNTYYEDYETKELNAYMNNIIYSLPEKCKEAFLLSRNKNYSYKDISGELKISISTVEKHIIKALKIIKYKLQQNYALN